MIKKDLKRPFDRYITDLRKNRKKIKTQNREIEKYIFLPTLASTMHRTLQKNPNLV